ncbi:MAG: PilC/PilY family type IV pilus protein [Abyssibacter sp.]|uniref:pilus assembly protein n=1 Tax=Abyssibacter sp. TaxID=2320200 RepID=UPI003218F065
MTTRFGNRLWGSRALAATAALCLSAGTALALDLPLDTLAGGGSQIPDGPIELGVSPPPVVMLLIDDSLSMSSNFLVDDEDAQREFGVEALTYRWIYPLPVDAPSSNSAYSNAYLHRLAVPTEAFVNAWNDEDNDFLRGSEAMLGPEYAGVWRARNAQYNSLYYDPAETYEPWPYGVDADGASFADASASAARLDPYDSSETLDLRAAQTFTTSVVTEDGDIVSATHEIRCTTSGPGCLNPANYVDLRETTAHYYTWTDTDGDGVVDADDAHTRVNITDAAELQNFANWFQYHRSRELRFKGRLSEFMAGVGEAYMGVATVNNNSTARTEVLALNEDPSIGNRRQVMDAIFSARGNAAGTPLQSALYDVGEYLECTGGTNLFGNTNCPRLAEEDDGQCQQGAIMLITDGYASADGAAVTSTGTPGSHGSAGSAHSVDNAPFGGVATNADGDDSSEFDGGAYGDSFSDTLADVAMHFYERDLDAALDSRQFVETYVLDLGLSGSLSRPTSTSELVAWGNPDPGDASFVPANRFDDLLHAAYNGRGRQCAVDDPNLVEKFAEALRISPGNSQGTTSVGITSGSILNNQRVFLATYDAQELTGDLIAYDLNLDGTLGEPAWSAAELLDQKIDSEGHADRLVLTYDPNLREGMPFSWQQFSDPSYRLSAVAALQLPPELYLTLEILVGLVNPVLNVVLAVEGTILESAIEPVQEEILNPILEVSALSGLGLDELLDTAVSPLYLNEIDLYSLLGLSRQLSQGRVNYLRGEQSNEESNGGRFRNRDLRMGPIYHSRPVVVGPPDTDYSDQFLDDLFGGDTPDTELYSTFRANNANRRSMVYVGANDGMLHGFDATTGEELFAYVPGRLLGKVSELTDPDYEAETYVDGQMSVVDAYDEFPACGAGQSCWRTILVGSLRGGGQGIYALDITDPEAFVAADTFSKQQTLAEQVVLWEFTDSPGGGLLGVVSGAKFLLQGLLTDGLYDILGEVLDPALIQGVIDSTVEPLCQAILGPLDVVCSLVTDLTDLLLTVASPVLALVSDLLGVTDILFDLPLLPTVTDLVDTLLEALLGVDEYPGSPELGYTFGQPNIVRLADGRWATVIGNGYHNTDLDLQLSDQSNPALLNLGVSATGNAVVFIIDLATGMYRPDDAGYVFDTGSGSFLSPSVLTNPTDHPISLSLPDLGDVSALSELSIPLARPNGIADVAPVDFDGDGIIDRLYAGDLRGALWRIDVDDPDPANWGFAFRDGNEPQPLFDASVASSSMQPIATRPEVTFHPSGQGYMLLFGTGKFHEVEDLSATGQDTQSFYGIWDQYAGGTTAPDIDDADLLEQTIDDESTIEADVDGDGVTEPTRFRVTSNNLPSWRTGTNTGADTHLGWKLDMLVDGETDNQGERILGDPRLRNGQISFATVIPGESQCLFEGKSWFFRLDAGSGGRTLIAPYNNYIDDLPPSAIQNDAISELPQVLLTPTGQEVNLARDEGGEINAVLTEPGGFERQRATWRELR